MLEYGLFLLTGALAGILAGLLGVGGGIIVVPVLDRVLPAHFPSDLSMHMAVGSSLAIMIFTSLSSGYAYFRRGLIVWPLFYKFLPGLLLGSVTGSFIAMYLSGDILRKAFGIFVIVVALYMFLSKQIRTGEKLPGFFKLSFVGFIVGIISGLFGIGGGIMIVPFFVYCSVEMLKATGTSSICAFPLAIVGTLSLIITGWTSDLSVPVPAGTTGYVYWPAVFFVSVTSILFAPIGTRIAVWLPKGVLKRMFSVLLVIIGINLMMG